MQGALGFMDATELEIATFVAQHQELFGEAPSNDSLAQILDLIAEGGTILRHPGGFAIIQLAPPGKPCPILRYLYSEPGSGAAADLIERARELDPTHAVTLTCQGDFRHDQFQKYGFVDDGPETTDGPHAMSAPPLAPASNQH